jgi:hypothetical protein
MGKRCLLVDSVSGWRRDPVPPASRTPLTTTQPTDRCLDHGDYREQCLPSSCVPARTVLWTEADGIMGSMAFETDVESRVGGARGAWRHRVVGLIALVIALCVVVPLAGASQSMASPSSSLTSTAQLRATCLRDLVTFLGLKHSSPRPTFQMVPADAFGSNAILLPVGSRGTPARCIGEQSARVSAAVTGVLTFSITHCALGGWNFTGFAGPEVAAVSFSNYVGENRVQPTQGHFVVTLSQFLGNGEPSGRQPLGTITAFDAKGDVLSRLHLETLRAIPTPVRDTCYPDRPGWLVSRIAQPS